MPDGVERQGTSKFNIILRYHNTPAPDTEMVTTIIFGANYEYGYW